MEAVITKSGLAVRKSGLSSLVFDIYGLLSSFKDFNQKQVIYLNVSNFSEESSEKALPGYYYQDEYALYMNNPSGYTIDKLIKNHTYKAFINAEIDDTIQVEIISTESRDNFYNYNEYNFKHLERSRNYLLDIYSQTLNPVYIGTGIPKTKLLHQTAKSFFYKQMSLFDSVPDDQKNNYFEYVVRCALRINTINRDIFAILLSPVNQSNLPSPEDLSLIETLINSLNSKWETEVILTNNPIKLLPDIINYYKILVNFYINCFSNQKYLKDSGFIVRLQYFINVLDIDLLSTINSVYKIKLLKILADDFNDKNLKLEPSQLSKAIVKISDSFKEDQTTQIDIFLEGLLKSSIEIKENERNKITLFEYIYRKLKNNFFEELWQHSPLYYKINSALNLEKPTSPLSAFITKIYTLWTQSKYNPNRNNIYNPDCIGYGAQNSGSKTFIYTHKPATTIYSAYEGDDAKDSVSIDINKAPLIINLKTFFINALGYTRDTIETKFVGLDKVVVGTIDSKNINLTGAPNPSAESQILNGLVYYPYGYYNLYQPIQIVRSDLNNAAEFSTPTHSWTDGSETIHQTYIPAFLFHYMQEREDTDFIYAFIWTVIKAAYKAVPKVFALKRMIETALEGIYETLEILETAIPENKYQIINDYGNQCALDNNDGVFCKLIGNLIFWLEDYRTANNQVIFDLVKRAAGDIVFYVEENGWPSDFDEEDGEARELIINLAGERTDCADIKQTVIKKVEAAEGYSINKVGTEEPLFSDADYDEICNYVSNLDLSDDFSFNSQKDIQIAFIFNAHRETKQAKVSEVKERIDYWINIKKPINSGGRDKIPYIFGNNIIEAQNNYSLFKQRMPELFGKYDLLKYEDKRIGGSALYKNPPGDIDTYLFVSNREIKNLIDEYTQTWLKLAGENNNRRKRERYEEYGESIEITYEKRQIIYGNLIIKYKPENPESKRFVKLKDDKIDPYYTSSLINFSGPKKEVFDITIKDSSKDSQGTPPYIILNL